MQQNIYFQKEVWGYFKDEPNKSNLINELLRKHYAFNKTTPAIVKPEPVTQSKIDSIKAMVPGMLTAADLAPKISERGLCKKCTSILDIRGRCLNKNCKMSKK